MENPELNLEMGEPDQRRALQMLLRLAAAKEGKGPGYLRGAETQAVVNELLADVDSGNLRSLAWFVYIAGRTTAVYATSVAKLSSVEGDVVSPADVLRRYEDLLENPGANELDDPLE